MSAPVPGAAPGVAADHEVVIGLEVHVQLDTRTKAFCRCSTAFGAPPNTNTCPVCLALPGALPVLNARAVELAVRAAVALGATVHPVSVFARKNYFYPDSPKGYQISQFDRPLATGGCLDIGETASGRRITVGITRIHMEEDAGKLLHDRFAGTTAVDLNRAGTPLIEIVTEPTIRSSLEAEAFLRTLKLILETIGVSDVSMEEGSLRVDANVSTRACGDTALGTRTEVKNLNSFSAVRRAVDAEFLRQCTILRRGDNVVQQTMLWDAERAAIRAARGKEGSADYRYFPDPDLPPLIIEGAFVDRVRRELPELPNARRRRFAEDYPTLAPYDIEVLTATTRRADYFEQLARTHGDAKTAANWMLGEVLAALRGRDDGIEQLPVRPNDLAELLGLVRDGIVSHSAAKRIFALMVDGGGRAAQIAEREGLLRVGDDTALSAWIDEVFAERPDEARRFVAGERRIQGVLVGLVLRKSGGRADPARVNQLLEERATAGT